MRSGNSAIVVPREEDSAIEHQGDNFPRVSGTAHIAVLDGWRGISILLVLAAHLLPLGPKAWKLNHVSGVMGMALFFILSGFLIASFLLQNQRIVPFLTRRLFRIVPLAWIYLTIAMVISGVTGEAWIPHLFFYANLPPQQLVPLTAHMWSVCMEVQFYVGIAILVVLAGRRGLLFIPVLCLAFTGFRMANDVYASSVSYYRIDEILAGCMLALVYGGRFGEKVIRLVRAIPLVVLIPLYVASCFPQGEGLNYLRPYLAALLIGSTLLNGDNAFAKSLKNRVLAYIAGISYALYVLHPLLAASWLGSGGIAEKYAKRPLMFLALFLVAHISTFYFERRCIAIGKKLGGSGSGGTPPG